MIYKGKCHCGDIQVEYQSEVNPSETEIRECQCSFCRMHGTQAIADPQGELTISVSNPDAVNRYTFGLKTADYLICKTCGVYVAAITRNTTSPRAILMCNVLGDRKFFSKEPQASVYDHETEVQRIERRANSWMPVTLKSV